MPPLRLLPDLEQILAQLPGVRAVSVVTDADAIPLEVHVVAAPGKPAKQVVRDVQSLALAEQHVALDHRIVSVVQLEDPIPAVIPAPVVEEQPPPPPVLTVVEALQDAVDVHEPLEAAAASRVAAPAAPPSPAVRPEPEVHRRAVLDGVVVGTRSSGFDASVTIISGADVFEGVAEGPVHGSQRFWLVARATIDAVSELLGVPCRVEHTSIVPAGDHRVALVVLAVRAPGAGDLALSGSALVRVDEPDAVARAVLDALNRRLEG